MIIRVTNKAARKLKCSPQEALPKSTNRLEDWVIHVFTDLYIFPIAEFPVSICKVGDRSLQGSINEMIYHAAGYMMDGLDNLKEIAKRINDMPMLSLPGFFPHRVHLSSERTIVE